MSTKTITQTVTLPAPPAAVYAALLNQKKHSKFTGAPATIDARVGGPFSCYGGYLEGVTLDLVKNKRIVQAWRSREWAKGVFSIVTFALSARRGGKTKLHFTHLGVPAGDLKAKSKGWRFHYWSPLKLFLAKR